jgi:hypothetical protein
MAERRRRRSTAGASFEELPHAKIAEQLPTGSAASLRQVSRAMRGAVSPARLRDMLMSRYRRLAELLLEAKTLLHSTTLTFSIDGDDGSDLFGGDWFLLLSGHRVQITSDYHSYGRELNITQYNVGDTSDADKLVHFLQRNRVSLNVELNVTVFNEGDLFNIDNHPAFRPSNAWQNDTLEVLTRYTTGRTTRASTPQPQVKYQTVGTFEDAVAVISTPRWWVTVGKHLPYSARLQIMLPVLQRLAGLVQQMRAVGTAPVSPPPSPAAVPLLQPPPSRFPQPSSPRPTKRARATSGGRRPSRRT